MVIYVTFALFTNTFLQSFFARFAKSLSIVALKQRTSKVVNKDCQFQLFDILDLVLKDQNGTKYCINTSQIQITFYFDYCVSVSTFIFAPCVNKKGGSFCNLIYVFWTDLSANWSLAYQDLTLSIKSFFQALCFFKATSDNRGDLFLDVNLETINYEKWLMIEIRPLETYKHSYYHTMTIFHGYVIACSITMETIDYNIFYDYFIQIKPLT